MLVYPDGELAASELMALLFGDDSEGITAILVDVTMDSRNRDGSAEAWVEAVGATVHPYPGKERIKSVPALISRFTNRELKHIPDKSQKKKKKIFKETNDTLKSENLAGVNAKFCLCLIKHNMNRYGKVETSSMQSSLGADDEHPGSCPRCYIPTVEETGWAQATALFHRREKSLHLFSWNTDKQPTAGHH
jgi:hypothetical protein